MSGRTILAAVKAGEIIITPCILWPEELSVDIAKISKPDGSKEMLHMAQDPLERGPALLLLPRVASKPQIHLMTQDKYRLQT